MKIPIIVNYISSAVLMAALVTPYQAQAQAPAPAPAPASDEVDKKPTRIVQDLLSEGSDYIPIERVYLNGQFILDRQQLKAQVALDAEQLFEKVAEQVFKIIVLDGASNNSRKVISMGSAVAINPNTLITNCHVLGSQRIFARVIGGNGSSRLVALKLVTSDRKTDRCMVRAEENVFKPVRGIRHSLTLTPGERIYSVGYPLVFDLSIAEGLIASVKKKGLRTIFLSTAATGKGSSGGALFDRYGYLVGITTAVITQADHYSLVIPASDYFGP